MSSIYLIKEDRHGRWLKYCLASNTVMFIQYAGLNGEPVLFMYEGCNMTDFFHTLWYNTKTF